MTRLLATLALALCSLGSFAADHPLIMVSIKPFYNITANVMRNVGTPELLIKFASPHDYTLKPSEAQLISDADLVVWAGPNLDAYLTKPIQSLANKDLNLEEIPGLNLLPIRDCHAPCMHGHSHSDTDPHFWLDPENAIIIATAIAEELAEIDPKNAETYRNNSKDFAKQIRSKELIWKETLQPYQMKPYVVSHDAFQYFNYYFKLDEVTAISLNPEVPPSVKRVQEIQEMLTE